MAGEPTPEGLDVTTLRRCAPDQSLLLPPDVRERRPEGHLARHVSGHRDTFTNLGNRGFPMLENRAFVVKLTRLFRF